MQSKKLLSLDYKNKVGQGNKTWGPIVILIKIAFVLKHSPRSDFQHTTKKNFPL